MALTLDGRLIREKNKISSEGAWVVLLEITLGETTLYFARNNEDIVWNGRTWTAFSFEIGEMKEDSKGERPTLDISVSNVTRQVQQYVEAVDGGIESEVIIRVVNSLYLDIVTPDLEEIFIVTGCTCDAKWVTFNLGLDYPMARRYPNYRLLKDFCPYKYGGVECGSTGQTLITYPTCPKTLSGCRERQTYPLRFGGEYGIPTGGFYVSNV